MAMVDGRRTCGKISGPRFCLFDFFSGLDPLFRHTTQHFSYPSHGLSLAILHFESVFFWFSLSRGLWLDDSASAATEASHHIGR